MYVRKNKHIHEYIINNNLKDFYIVLFKKGERVLKSFYKELVFIFKNVLVGDCLRSQLQFSQDINYQ